MVLHDDIVCCHASAASRDIGHFACQGRTAATLTTPSPSVHFFSSVLPMPISLQNFTSRAVMDCLGSALTNKYAEGLPGARYYGGNEIVDQVERLCQTRALAAYRLDDSE